MDKTIKGLLREGVQMLKTMGIEENLFLDAQLILCHVLGVDKLYLMMHPEEIVYEGNIVRFFGFIHYRGQGMPLQYITGIQDFMSLSFKVTRDVLIPRGDTEILVEAILDKYRNKSGEARIMDIGTGSGCIAISLASYMKESQVYAVDISPEALKIARDNAIANHVVNRLQFIQQDILEGFPQQIEKESLDIVVSNPPYIMPEVIDTLQKEVKDYEPMIALDGGPDGLVFYRNITEKAHSMLKSRGLLAFEAGHDQSQEVKDLLEKHGGYEAIETRKDLAGIHRVVMATKR